jgi:hypothetical protein
MKQRRSKKKADIEEFIVSGLSEFITCVRSIVNQWSSDKETLYPWFRGQSSSEWDLLPSIYRNPQTQSFEDEYRIDFKLKAYPFLPDNFSTPESDLEWYFLMQHYGIPTRLLDWSESALISLYFAVNYGLQKNTDSVVWVLNPWKLNELITQKSQYIYTSWDEEVKEYILKPYSRSEQVVPDKPIAIVAPFKSSRIAAQRGLFTLHGSDQSPLNKHIQLLPYLKKIIIPAANRNDFMIDLTIAGITESLIFPELAGLAKEIVLRYST